MSQCLIYKRLEISIKLNEMCINFLTVGSGLGASEDEIRTFDASGQLRSLVVYVHAVDKTDNGAPEKS